MINSVVVVSFSGVKSGGCKLTKCSTIEVFPLNEGPIISMQGIRVTFGYSLKSSSLVSASLT